MRKWTQDEVDAIKKDKTGLRHFPTGDYRNIGSFGEGCSFGERCSFGEWCSFGEGCLASSPYWSFVYEPPFTTRGKIYPTELTRTYWQERLGIDMSGCYNDIETRLKPVLPSILTRQDLTKWERRILTSWL